nr:hypothetical protein [Rhodococcus sp. 06-621-2]
MSEVLSNILTVGPLLAGSSALVALGLTITKGAVLRRQEGTLRDALEAFTAPSRHHSGLSQLHRATLAALVARQTHGPWPFILPWLAWLLTVAIFGQTGFLLGRFTERGSPFDIYTFTHEVFGGGLETLVLAPAAVPMLAIVFRAYERAVLRRARTARAFYNTGAIKYGRPAVGLDRYIYRRERRPDRPWWWTLIELSPGTAAMADGLLVGLILFRRFGSEQDVLSNTLMNVTLLAIVTAVFVTMGAAFAMFDLRERRLGIEKLPLPRVPRAVWARRAREALGY